MTLKRILAIVLIYVLATAGWYALGFSTSGRSRDRTESLGAEVEALWGTAMVQGPLQVETEAGESGAAVSVPLSKSDVTVHLAADHRKRGLVWYPTYVCSFDGTYTVASPEGASGRLRCRFVLPAKGGTYEDFVATLDGKSLDLPLDRADAVEAWLLPASGSPRQLRIAFRTRGMGEWRYDPGRGDGRVRNLSLKVTTSFTAVDYPEGCLSPTQVQAKGDGMALTWGPSDLITRAQMGVVIPGRLNPGPLTTRITFFAPVCLLFFFILVMTITIVHSVNIHPMHYLFVSAGFFAFHLLLAYLADVMAIHVAFAVSATASLALVTSYLSAALRGRLPWKVALLGQAFFLVLFSYSFFLEGVTGLVVSLGAVVTLAILMRVTAHVDWDLVFADTRGSAPVS